MDEVKIWGKLKHDNLVKCFIWFEDLAQKQNKMFLMMQYADLGQIATYDEPNQQFNISQPIFDRVSQILQKRPELANFGKECVSQKEKVCKFLFSQVAQGIQYMHETALVVNRDIKPENMLFTTQEGGTNIYLPDRVQITDFTTVIKLPEENPDDFYISGAQGTKIFEAPEVTQR